MSVVFSVLTQMLDSAPVPAACIAFGIAVANNFAWNRHWTFRASAGHAGHQAARFLTISLVGLGINLVILLLLVDVAGIPEVPGQAIAVAMVLPVNFLGNKLWTFGPPGMARSDSATFD